MPLWVVSLLLLMVMVMVVLSNCWKTKGDDEQAMEFASQAAQLAELVQDPLLLSRTHNNLALYCFQRRELTIALDHLLTAYKAAQATEDFPQQAVIKYHIGLVVAELGVGVELSQTSQSGRIERSSSQLALRSAPTALLEEEEEQSTDRRQISHLLPEKVIFAGATASTGPPAGAATSPGTLPAPVSVSASASPTAADPSSTASAKDCFILSETLASALPDQGQDHSLSLLAHGCQGESEYFAGEFHTAEAEFSIALRRLRELQLVHPSPVTAAQASSSQSTAPTSPHPLSTAELDKIHGHLLSFIGCTQLVEGKFDLAEDSHQRDLDIALHTEDIYAQQRAMRNLALVYSSTQRYSEAIPLWREALEIANVLQNKPDQMMAYSGLGTAMKELRITDREKGEFVDLLGAKENDPLHIFLRQRALAVELGDKNQQIIAQRNIVSTYESPDRADIEQRLTECDALVRLCEQYENLQYRGDAYRSLANALTAQIARLSVRGARFAEAVGVLTQKRNSVCGKYQQTTRTLRAVAVMMLKSEEEDGGEMGDGNGSPVTLKKPKKPSGDDKHPRPPISRVEVLLR